MANTIKHKRSSVAARVPTPEDLQAGELAINTADIALYTKNAANVVVAVNDWVNIRNKPNLDAEYVSTEITVIDTTGGPAEPDPADLPDGQWGVFFDTNLNTIAIFARRDATVYRWNPVA